MKFRHFALLAFSVFWTLPAAYSTEIAGRHVDLPNVQLWIVDSGGTGDPVILLHPRTGNADYWQYTVSALAEAGFRAIAIDNPGWGRSILRSTQNSKPIAETIDSLIDHLNLGAVHLVGTANGGYTALDYAGWKPERVKSMVIAASGLGLQNDPEYDAFRKRSEIPGLAEQPSEIRELSPLYRGMNPEGVLRWKEIYKNAQQEGAPTPPFMSPNTPEKLAAIRVPTFIIAGGTDLVSTSGAMRMWSRHLTVPYEFHVMPEAGHVLVWEQPEQFNEVLINFLKKH
jgi:pimeloyl-ACP methyl ester carboxylesterase